MSKKAKSAELIMQLYDLRRETKMREARNWFFTFNPKSSDEIMQTMMDPEVGGYLRMVTSYWDMAASFVNHGAIDADMFNETAGEHVMVFAKIEPFLSELREKFEMPESFANLEKVIMGTPKGAERLRKTQEWLRTLAADANNGQAGEAAA